MDEGKLSLFVQEGFSMKRVCDLAVGLTGGFVWTARVGRDGIYRQHEIDRSCDPAVELVEWDLMRCPIIEPDESDYESPYTAWLSGI